MPCRRPDSARTILKRIASEAGVDPLLVTPHRLRHYFGLSSAMAGVPTTALMRAMGLRSPIMTARYSEFVDAERRWAFARADTTKGARLSVPRPHGLGAPIPGSGLRDADRHDRADAVALGR